MKATLICEDGTTSTIQVRVGDIDLTRMLNIIRVEVPPFNAGDVVKSELYLELDMMKLMLEDIEVNFKAQSGTVKDLDEIIESLQKLRIMMSKEEEVK